MNSEKVRNIGGVNKSSVGEVFQSRVGGEFTIIDYDKPTNVTIEFNDENKYRCVVQSGAIKNGGIKNPYAPTRHGVGYVGAGSFKTSMKSIPTDAYATWSGMMHRCYCPKTQISLPSYNGCTVHKDWHNFQVFAKWFYEQSYYKKGYHLDKDILIGGNRVYSAETCCLVPKELNVAMIYKPSWDKELPCGVSKKANRYIVKLGVRGKREYLGSFECMQEAQEVYELRKIAYVRELADEFKEDICERVYNRIMSENFNFEIY